MEKLTLNDNIGSYLLNHQYFDKEMSNLFNLIIRTAVSVPHQ